MAGGHQKGDPKTGGRRKGTANKVTKELRQMVLDALDGVGGQAYLEARAHDQPKAFLALVSRCLPKDIRIGMLEYLELNFIGVKRAGTADQLRAARPSSKGVPRIQ